MPRRHATKLRLTSLEDRVTPTGGLDGAFGTDGRVMTVFDGRGPAGVEFVSQPDGDLVILEETSLGSRATRYNADGSLDTGFGTAGVVAEPIPGVPSFIGEAVNAPDGKLLIVGLVYPESYQNVVARLNADGSLDTSFGSGGVYTVPTSGSFGGTPQLVPQADGSTVVLIRDNSALTVRRLTPTGELDATFGTAGVASIPVTNLFTHAFQAAAAPDGGIYVLTEGFPFPGNGPKLRDITKLTAAGTLDAGFGVGGVAEVGAVGEKSVGGNALVVQTDGKPVVAIVTSDASSVVLQRFNVDGTLDTSFGDGGRVTAIPRAGDYGFASLTQLPDGRLVVASGRVASNYDAAVAVLNADGTPNDFLADSLAVATPAEPDTFVTVVGAAVSEGRVMVLTMPDAFGVPSGHQSSLDLLAFTEGSTAIVPPPDQPVTPIVSPPDQPVTPVIPIGEPGGPQEGFVDPTSPPVLQPGGTDPQSIPFIDAPLPPRYRVAGDVNGDGVADRVVTDGPRVSVVSGADGQVLIPAFAPFEATYTGDLNAVFVDVDDDGRSELVVSPRDGGGPVVAVYNADGTERGRFFGIDDPAFRGGVNLALAYTTPDNVRDLIVTPGAGGGPRVAIFEGATLGRNPRKVIGDFFAFEPTVPGLVIRVVSDDSDRPETLVFAAGPGGGPRVRTVTAPTLGAAGDFGSLGALPAGLVVVDRFVGDPTDRGGVTLAVRPIGPATINGDPILNDLGNVLTAQAGDGEPVPVVNFGSFAPPPAPRPPYTGPDAGSMAVSP